jgi:D-alanyl-D-alanine carboxypeptidase
MTRRWRFIGLALALAAIAVAVGYAQNAAAIDTAEKFTVTAPATDQKTLDAAPAGPSLGDRFVFSGPLQNRAGTRDVGRIDGVCTTTSTPAGEPDQNRQQCQVTATIVTANGETEIELQGVGRVLAEDVLAAVTGGTGKYQNARGQALFDFRTPDRVVVTFSLIP